MEFHSQRLPVATLLLPFPSYWATSLSLPEVCILGVTLHRMVLSCMFPGSLLTIPSPPARPQNVDSYLRPQLSRHMLYPALRFPHPL